MSLLSGDGMGKRPNPPMRRTPSVASSASGIISPTHLSDLQEDRIMMLSASPPPPPAPQPHIAPSSQHSTLENDSRTTGLGNDGSNSTTPRGSMENLPPPPPDLLHSDDDENMLRAASQPKVYTEKNHK